MLGCEQWGFSVFVDVVGHGQLVTSSHHITEVKQHRVQ